MNQKMHIKETDQASCNWCATEQPGAQAAQQELVLRFRRKLVCRAHAPSCFSFLGCKQLCMVLNGPPYGLGNTGNGFACHRVRATLRPWSESARVVRV